MTRADGREWNETDYTATYVCPWQTMTVEADIVRYAFQHQPGVPSTTEATGKISIPVGPWRLFTTQNVDIDRFPGAVYSEFGGARTWRISSAWSIDSTMTLGLGSAEFNAANLGVHKAAANAATLDMGVSLHTGSFTIRPHMTGATILDSTLRRSVDRPDNLDIGISVERDW